jgi:nuclear pore complex protein Nup62
MDEILNRWAGDLSKYQAEFQQQAEKVASWDRLLVDNGLKIQKLYIETSDAKRAASEVERQISHVESQQDELDAWLTKYEQDTDQMFAAQVGGAESLQGPDQDRHRTYKMAEKLSDRLDDMGKDLGAMIEEINSASSNLSKTSKPDDPVSHYISKRVFLLFLS